MPITYLTGPAGTGKTTRAVQQLRQWLEAGIPGHDILVLVPQRTLARPYLKQLADPALSGCPVEVVTLYGLARRTVSLFWPLVAHAAGFARPEERPVFLTIETAQYYLRQVLEPLRQQGYFDASLVHLPLPRLMSQLLDNLNKAALIGLPHTEVAGRLTGALELAAGPRVALEQMQTALNEFRSFCLARNLLDFSLQIELFWQRLWPRPQVQSWLAGRYRYLVVDNLEEDTFFAHELLREWLPLVEEALLINDEDAGFRLFLGASPRSALALQPLAGQIIRLAESWVMPAALQNLGDWLAYLITGADKPAIPPDLSGLAFEHRRFYPQLLQAAARQVEDLLNAGVPAGEIVVLAPFVSDLLALSLQEQLKQHGRTVHTLRPSRLLLADEPVVKMMLTLAGLAFPAWNLSPHPFDVALALRLAIGGMDPVRASLLTGVVYQPKTGQLSSYAQIEGSLRQRITEPLGQRFDQLRAWLYQFGDDPPALDHFCRRLFNELLAQPGFGCYQQPEAGAVVADLIESFRKFRQVAAPDPDLNQTYLALVQEGLAAAQYIADWEPSADGAVLLAPVTTFLMHHRPVDTQLWLDVGSPSWGRRISQPLTQPYLLAHDWPAGRVWTDEDETAAQDDRLRRLVLGLTRRCRRQVICLQAELGEQGAEQRGPLFLALQRLRYLAGNRGESA